MDEPRDIRVSHGGGGGSGEPRPRGTGVLRRLFLALGGLVAGVVGLCLLIVLLLLIPTVRSAALSTGLRFASAQLPGRLSVQRATWPTPETFLFENVRWTAEGDTLLSIRRLSLSIGLRALLDRDLALHELSLDGSRLDVPGILAHLPMTQTKPPATSRRSFPRAGSLPFLPSMALEQVHLHMDQIHLPDSSSVRGAGLDGRIELRAGRVPEIRVNRLSGRDPERGWGVDTARVAVAPLEGRIEAMATGWFGRDWPFFFSCVPAGKNTFSLLLTRSKEDRVPESAGIRLDGNLNLEGIHLKEAVINGVVRAPGTSELERVPALSAALSRLPNLAGPTLLTQVSLRFDPELSGDASIELAKNDWEDGGVFRLAYRENTLFVDTLRLGLPDLRLEGRGLMTRGNIQADARLLASGARWLELLRPGVPGPAPLRAELSVHASGKLPRPAATLSLRGDVGFGRTRIDTVEVEASVSDGWKKPAQARLSASAYDLWCETSVEAALDQQPLEIRAAPIRILASPAPAGPPEPLEAVIRLPGPDENLLIRNLRVEGVLGALQCDVQAGRRPGTFQVSWSSAGPPDPLLERIKRNVPIDSLRAAWLRNGPYHFALAGTIGPLAGSTPPIQASGSFTLPGPAMFSWLLPPKSDVSGMGAVKGVISLTTSSGAENARAGIDLGSTAWVDTGRVEIEKTGTRLAVDTLDLSLPGLRLRGSGRMADSNLVATGELVVPDTRLIARFVPALRSKAELSLDAQFQFHGTRTHPEGSFTLKAKAATPGFSIPELTGGAELTGAGAQFRLRAPAGLQVGAVDFDSARVDYASAGAPLLPGAVRLTLRGPDLDLRESARIAQTSGSRSEDTGGARTETSGWEVTTDTLRLGIGDEELHSAHPFVAAVEASNGGILIRNLDLEGSLGKVQAEGTLSPGGSNLRASAQIHPSAGAQLLGDFHINASALPKEASLDLRVSGTDSLIVEAGLTGLPIGNGAPLDVHARARSGGTGIRGSLTATMTADTTARGQFTIPLEVTVFPFRTAFRNGPLDMETQFAHFPVVFPAGEISSKQAMQFDGVLRARGTPSAPSVYFDGTVHFPKWRKLDRYSVQVSALAQPPGGADTSVTALAGPTSLLRTKRIEIPQEPGVVVAVSLQREQTEVLSGLLKCPLEWPSGPGSGAPRPVAPLSFSLEGDKLSLEDFDGLLPPDVSLSGTAGITLSAGGDPRDPTLQGSAKSKDLSVDLADGTKVDAEVNITFGGTAQQPSATGTINVHHGVLMVQSQVPTALPIQGDALLWDLQGAHEAGRDSILATATAPAAENGPTAPAGFVEPGRKPPSTEGAAPGNEPASSGAAAPGNKPASSGAAAPGNKPSAPASPAPAPRAPGPYPATTVQASYDVTVDIPSGLYVRGQGLDVELNGNLHVAQRGPRPTISGELDAASGHYEFLGRQFQIQDGKVIFQGGDEINPTLDLTLVAQIGSTQVTIHLTGTALVPKLSLSSQPEMAEGDIMSLVVFGIPMNDLNTAQFNLLKNRASEVATTYATSQLTSRLSRQLGVDILSVQETTGPQSQTQSALVVGKYLNPKVLVKYQQTLAQGGSILLNLEYYLTRRWTFASVIGWETGSGLEIRWTDER